MAPKSVKTPGLKSFQSAVFDVCCRLSNARRQTELRTLANPPLSELGANVLVCIEVPPLAGDAPWHWVAVDQTGWSLYVLDGIDDDPVIRAIRRSPRTGTWAELLGRRRLGAPARERMDQAVRLGLKQGYAVPTFGQGGLNGMVLIGGQDLRLDPMGRLALTWIGEGLFRRVDVLRTRGRRRGPVLTSREIEILRWIVAGKSDWQIGQILRISSKTVNFHVENVKPKFGVATRIQAVIAAVRRGMIQP